MFPLLEPSSLVVSYRSVLLILFTFTALLSSCSHCLVTMPASRSVRKVTKKTPYAKPSATSTLPGNGKAHSPKLRPSSMGPVTFSSDLQTASLLIFLSSTIAIHFSYHMQIISDCLIPFSLSLIPTIVDRPLHYQVARLLSFYQWLLSYHVRYIDPQSGGTVGLGLCPLRSLTLTRSEPSRSI